MKYDIRALSTDMLSPVHGFPGDEIIDQATYRRTIFSGYVSSAATLYGVARGYGLQPDGETFERWKRIGAAAGLLDDFLDESPDIQVAGSLYERGLASVLDYSESMAMPAWTDRRLGPAVQLLRNSVEDWPISKRSGLIHAAREIGRTTLAKARVADVAEYIELLKSEAHYSGLLIHGSVSEAVEEQPAFDDFRRWCDNALEFGTLADHTRDLWSDRKHGRTRVEPTIRAALRIALQTRQPARTLIRPSKNRQATIAGMVARIRYAPLPTTLVLKIPPG